VNSEAAAEADFAHLNAHLLWRAISKITTSLSKSLALRVLWESVRTANSINRMVNVLVLLRKNAQVVRLDRVTVTFTVSFLEGVLNE
jgi:hypothetical protein